MNIRSIHHRVCGIAAIALSLLSLHPATAQWDSPGTVESFTQRQPGDYLFRTSSSTVEVTVLARDLVRVRLHPGGVTLPPPPADTRGRDTSWAVVKTAWPRTDVSVTDDSNAVTLTTAKLSVVIRRNPLRILFRDRAGNVINADDPVKGMCWAGRNVRVWKTMPADERYYGFGEKAGRLARNNSHVTMWNSDIPAYGPDTDPLYKSVPFFYGIRKGMAYGIFFDNTWRSSFDMGKESRSEYSFGAEDGLLEYYFLYGPAPADVLRRFTELVGRMPLPPRWSLGYQQSRWSYSPESRVREIARTFREKQIPCDVIYLDIDYMDGYRIFTWNKERFPAPQRMISDLRKDGFRIAVIVDPGIKVDSSYAAYRTGLAGSHFLTSPDGSVFTGDVWPGLCAFPDFTDASTRSWWGASFAGLAEAGVRGWWNDMNEPSVFNVPTKTVDLRVIHDDHGMRSPHGKNHNIYGMQMTRGTYEGIRALIPDERPFVLTRATYAGGQRYSAVWTGDNVASWEHLAMAVTMCLNLSVSGHAFVGADIGGFIGYPSGELFARWLQAGVFTPLMRAHSAINERNKEPWEYGTAFTDINRETINLRYRLLPYIYTVMETASRDGLPAMRPMIFSHPDEEAFQERADQFMFGDDLLVAPVLSEGATHRDVRLPAGGWYDFWTSKRLDGGRDITADAPVSRIPLFIRAGTILPMQQPVQYTDQAPIDPLTFVVYPATSGSDSSAYYEDDGISFRYQAGEFLRRTVRQEVHPGQIVVDFGKPEGTYAPSQRSLIVEIVDGSNFQRVTLDGKSIPKVSPQELSTLQQGWAIDPTRGVLTAKIPDARMRFRLVAQE